MKKHISCILVFAICAVLFGGCGQKEDKAPVVQYQMDESATDGDAKLSDTGQMHVNYEVVSGDNTRFTVDADVEGLPMQERMRCYEVEKVSYDEAYLDECVIPVFDSDTARYVKPYMICSKEELKSRKSLLQSKQTPIDMTAEAADIMEKGLERDLEYAQIYLDNIDESDYIAAKDEKIYRNEYKTGAAYKQTRIDGLIDDIPVVYETYEIQDADEKNDLTFWISSFTRYDFLNQPIIVRNRLSEEYVENLDYDTAKKQADMFMETIGYGEFVSYGEGIGSVSDGDGNMSNALYCFSYSRCPDGIQVAATAGCEDLRFEMKQQRSTSQESIEIAVDKDGVAKVKIRSALYDRKDPGTEIESYLTFEQVDAAAQEYMKSYIDTSGSKRRQICHIRLSYIYACFDGQEYSLIPVWAYYGMRPNSREGFLFGVSAIDGQIINGSYLMLLDSTYQM